MPVYALSMICNAEICSETSLYPKRCGFLPLVWIFTLKGVAISFSISRAPVGANKKMVLLIFLEGNTTKVLRIQNGKVRIWTNAISKIMSLLAF